MARLVAATGGGGSVLRPSAAVELPVAASGPGTWMVALAVGVMLAAGGLAGATLPGAIGVPVALAVILVFVLRPLYGLALLLAVRPLLDEWANSNIFPIGHSHPLNAGSMAALIVLSVGGMYVFEHWQDVRTAPAIRPFLAFFGLALLSVPTSLSKSLAVTEVLRLGAVIVIYAIAYAVVRRRRDAIVLASAILVSAVPPMVAGLWQYGTGAVNSGHNLQRAHGTFVVVDAFGIFMALVITFGTALALTRGTRLQWFVLAAAPFAIASLISSYGRTGWIASTFGVVVVATLRYRWLLLVLGVLIVGLAVAAPSTSARFQNLSQTQGRYGNPGNTLNGRVQMWLQALPNVERRPVIGLGFGSNAIANGKRQVANDYVRALVETGVPGLIAFVWTLAATLAASWRAMSLVRLGTDRVMQAVVLGSFAVVPAYMLMSGSSNLMTQIVIAGMFWSMVAIGHAYARRDWEGLLP